MGAMPRWLEDIAGPDYASAILWTAGALILLVVVLGIVRIVRGMTFGTFVAGGRNRKTRLAVMDATAVDSHRRLVLVRRDDVEHLILIGGPTDVVVEQNIRMGQQVRRPALTGEQRPGIPPQRPPRPPQSPQHGATPNQGNPPPAQRPRETTPGTTHSPPRLVAPQPTPAPVIPLTPNRDNYLPRDLRDSNVARGSEDEIDRALMDELSVSLEEPPKAASPVSLEDEMNKLFGEISGQGKKRSS
jgi:hypothetical protein